MAARTPKFRVTHSPNAPKAKRYRYAIIAGNGALLQSGEGYPTHQHVTRAVEALWTGLVAAVLGTEIASAKEAFAGPAVPYTRDSLKPDGKPGGIPAKAAP